MQTFEHHIRGHFNLSNQRQYFQQCVTIDCSTDHTVLSFSIDGFNAQYATAVVSQPGAKKIKVDVYAEPGLEQKAFEQVLSVFSLNVDDAGWALMGERDAFIGQLQKKYDYLRPGLFYSPYEAAVSFIIGNRISIKQRQAIMQEVAMLYGHETTIEGKKYFAFPAPGVLLELNHLPGINETKMKNLKTIAQAAMQGWLSREHLLSMPVEMALQQLKQIKGVGDFYATGILFRGAGIVHAMPDDELTAYAMQQAYGLKQLKESDRNRIVKGWQPYEMWCNVLLHVWLRHEPGLPQRRQYMRKKMEA